MLPKKPGEAENKATMVVVNKIVNLKIEMHQQNCKQQILKRGLSINWYNTLMPIGHTVLFSEATDDDTITRLCKANE